MPFLAPLEKASNGVIKPRDLDGWRWASYSQLIREGIISPEVQPRSELSSNLLFVANLNFGAVDLTRTDGFTAQLVGYIYKKIWFYYFGRVKTLLWMNSPAWHALVAGPSGHSSRKKVTIMRELCCDARVIARVPGRKADGEHRHSLRIDGLDFEEELILRPKDFTNAVYLVMSDLTKIQGPCALIELNPFETNKTQCKHY
jgi:Ribosomal RNA adenine dimethylase